MGQSLRRVIGWVAAFALVASAPALAQISKTDVKLPRRTAGTNCVAYDSVNGVYLVVMNDTPVAVGRFVRHDGTILGSEFVITDEREPTTSWVGWYSIAFGGPAGDPVFLFTYLAEEGRTHIKYGRLIRYRAGGTPEISGRRWITDTKGVWYAAEKAQVAWDGDRFVVGTYVQAGGPYPEPQLHHVDTGGSVSGGQLLGDGLDYYGAPAVACSPADKVCLVTGYAAGIPFGPNSQGGSYFRLVDARSLQPLTPMGYLDDHTSRAEDQGAVFNPYTRQFLTIWAARWAAGGWIDNRLVNLDGTMEGMDYGRSFGPGVGENRIAYNLATRTSLLVSKRVPLSPSIPEDSLYAVELGDDGAPVRPDNIVLLAPWDRVSPLYKSGIAADALHARWFVIMWFGDGRSYLVQGGSTAPPPPPPPAHTPVVTTTGTIEVQPGGLVTITGSGFGATQGTSVVLLGSTPLPVESWSDTEIRVRIPADAASGLLTVRVNGITVNGPTVTVRRRGLGVVDFDGDGRTDPAIYNRPTRTWYWLKSSTAHTAAGSVVWGDPTDVPVPGDYDGDGKTDVAIYRPATGVWWLLPSSTDFDWTRWYATMKFGASGDVPVPADYDGDGKTDIAIYRPPTGTWFVLTSSSGFRRWAYWGWGVQSLGDIPAPGDYDGDGKTDLAVYRSTNRTWYLLNSSTGNTTSRTVVWGDPTDVPVPADYDGDGRTDMAVFRPSTGEWWLLPSSTDYDWTRGYQKIVWGGTGDVPAPSDHDGDGKADIAVWRSATGVWYVLKSRDNYNWGTSAAWLWGAPGDVPLRR